MKKINQFYIVFLILQCVCLVVEAQVVINGRNPRRYHLSGADNSISISYGYNIWVDGGHTPMSGYSESRAVYHEFQQIPAESPNNALGIMLGYEKRLASRFWLKGLFSTAKLHTGTSNRPDLITEDRSTFTQLGLYAKYSLTKDPYNRFQFQLIAGPELLYANRNLVVHDYVSEEEEGPSDVPQIISIVEAAVLGGAGISYRVTGNLSVFTESMIGLSLPGQGLKSTNTGLGLKYTW